MIEKADAGHQLRFAVQAINAAATSPFAYSASSSTVPQPPAGPTRYSASSPSDPPQVKGSKCRSSEKPTSVGKLFVCYAKAKSLGGGRWELTGDVTINRAIYINDAPLTIDRTKGTIDASGKLTTGVILDDGSKRKLFSATRFLVLTTTKTPFPIELTSARLERKLLVAGLPVQMLNAAGYLESKPTQLQLAGYQNERKLKFTTGLRMLEGAVTVSGTGTYKGAGKGSWSVTLKGCFQNPVPVGGSDRILELRNACLTESGGRFTISADARVLGSVDAKGKAALVGGALDSFSVDVASTGKVAIPFGAYLSGGGIDVTGLRGNPVLGGTVYGGWPYNPSGVNAEVTITGRVEYDTGARRLRIDGDGAVTAGGVVLGTGNVDLMIQFAGNVAPSAAQLNARMDALGGFIQGNIEATLSGTGFFASTTATVGFPAGSPITDQANYRIREITKCHWVPWPDVCPKVTGLSGTMQVAVSNKGVGARGGIGDGTFRVSATAWWIAAGNSWGFDIQRGESAALDFLRRVEAGGKGGGEVFAKTAQDTFVVAKGADFLALQLSGSTNGHVVLRNPAGEVVADSAAATFAEGVGVGRDPSGSGDAVLMVPPVHLTVGTWTVVRSGLPTFSRVVPVIGQPTPDAQVTSVAVVGAPASTTRLTSGRSRVRIEWEAPTGVKVGLRATDATGDISVAITSGRSAKGSHTWQVPATWAGPLRIEAVSERDGVPTSAATFAKRFVVVRPQLGAPSGLRLTRRPNTAVLAGWRAVPGATSYDLQVRIAGARTPVALTAATTRATLDLRAGGRIQFRVRGVTALGLPGPWSPWAGVGAAPKRVARPRR